MDRRARRRPARRTEDWRQTRYEAKAKGDKRRKARPDV